MHKSKIANTLILLLIVLAASRLLTPSSPGTKSNRSFDNSEIIAAFENHRKDLLVTGEGTVAKILPDDLKGSRHQKFIVKIGTQHTVLIAHNIDLAPRINDLQHGDTVRFSGEYEYNRKGGVIHWTHHDPKGRHPGGWILHNGRTYE